MFLFRYLYTDGVKLTGDNVCALLYTANKYNVQLLVEKCEDFFKHNMTTDNVCTIMQTACTLGLDTLVQTSRVFIEKHQQVFNVNNMKALSQDCLRVLIASDRLPVQENSVLTVVLGWADEQCRKQSKKLTADNRRQVLGDLLFLVRFPLIDPKTFTDIADSGLLTADEQQAVFKTRARGHSDGKGKFSFQPRAAASTQHLVPRHLLTHQFPLNEIICCKTSKAAHIHGVVVKFGNCSDNFIQRNFNAFLDLYPNFNLFGQHLSIHQLSSQEVVTVGPSAVTDAAAVIYLKFPTAVSLNPNPTAHLFHVRMTSDYKKITMAGYQSFYVDGYNQQMHPNSDIFSRWCSTGPVIGNLAQNPNISSKTKSEEFNIDYVPVQFQDRNGFPFDDDVRHTPLDVGIHLILSED